MIYVYGYGMIRINGGDSTSSMRIRCRKSVTVLSPKSAHAWCSDIDGVECGEKAKYAQLL